MTIQELVTKYGVKSYTPSIGLSITNIVDILYSKRSDEAYLSLTTLNNRQDWDKITDCSNIRYLDESCLEYIDEITS